MQRAARWLLAGTLCLLLGAALAQAPDPRLQELDQLQTLSQRNSAEALKALQAAAGRFASAPAADIRRTYLAAVMDAAFEAGQSAVVTDAIAQLQALATERGDGAAQLLALCAQARQLAITGRTREALEALERASDAARQVTDPWARWLYHLSQGSIQTGAGQFEPALDNLLRSLELARQLPRQAANAELRSRTHLELLHFDMKNPERALQVIREALPLAERLDARQALGWLHLHRGNVENVMGRLDVALAAYQQALQIARGGGLAGLQATALNNMGDIHLQRKAYVQAEPVMREAMTTYRAANELGGAALAQVNLGFALMGQGRIAAGVQEVQSGIHFVHESGAKPMEEQMLGELSRMYEQAGLYREAIETARRQQVLARELFQRERDQAVGALQERFDATERQRQIEQLAQANRLQDAELQTRRTQQMALVGAVAVTVVSSGFILWLYRRSRAANRALAAARRQAEDALAEKNLFLATASHDLRQPIHAMSLMVEAIGMRNQTAALQPLLADLRHSMQAMAQLFNALLDLSRLETGHWAVRSEALALAPLLTDTVRELRETAGIGGVRLRLRLPRREAVVTGDPVLLRQALLNLAHNAIRYARGGQVLIGVRPRGASWQVEVWDNGIGMEEAEARRVFDPFYRSETAHRLDSAGHGLGLAVVARSARLMGATYGLQSRLGRGSRFWLCLKASDAADHGAAAPTPAAPTPTADRSPLPPGRCLVLDDEPQVLLAWRALFEAWGIEARYADSTAQAHAHLDAGFVPQAIFCDQRLRAGESGLEVLQSLLDRCPEASGAMVSGEFHSAELARAEEEGYLVLYKPLDPTALHGVLAHWLVPPQRPAEAAEPAEPADAADGARRMPPSG